MSVRLVHLADVHLGAPLAAFGEYAKRRREEQEAAFHRSVEAALSQRAQIVVIAGDLFDTWRPEPAAVNLVRRELDRLRKAGIKVFLVPGTHDSIAWAGSVYRSETLPVHRLFTDPGFDAPASLEIEGTPFFVYGIAYDPRRSERGWSSLRRTSEEGIHVAVAHAACRSDPGRRIAGEGLAFEESELSGFGMDYVALGHHHDLRLLAGGERVLGAYSGSVEGTDWSETGPRHVVVVEWAEPGDPPDVRPVEVQSRIVEEREVPVDGVVDQEEIAVAIEEACPPEWLWRIRLVGEPEVVPRPHVVEATLRPRYGHLRVEDETTLVDSHLLSERLEEETVRGEFFRRLLERREAAAEGRERTVADRAIKLGLKVFG